MDPSVDRHAFAAPSLPDGSLFPSYSSPRRPSLTASAGRADSLRPTSSRGRSRANMVTPDEFDALPPSIQKKYFSSVERLRIAQESAVQKRQRQRPAQAWQLPRPSQDASIRPKSAHTLGGAPSFFSHSRTPASKRSDADVTEQQALLFLSLPDKVKRAQFTPEELFLMTESSERVLGIDAVRSASFNLSIPSSSRDTSLDSLPHSTLSRSTQSSYFLDPDPDDRRPRGTLDTTTVFPLNSDELRAPAPGVPRLRQSSITSTRSAMAPSTTSTETQRSERRRMSFSTRRSIALAPIPLPPPRLAPAVPPLPSPTKLQNMKGLVSSEWSGYNQNQPTTKYYKDSQAREQVRKFLATPEKFDEAVEFGFPTQRSTSTTPSLEAPNSSSDLDTSRRDGDRFDDEDESPLTPAASPGYHPAHMPSVDSGIGLVPSTKFSARSLSPDLGGREMTLRLTLTRPDLRASERELYSVQRKQVSGVEVETTDPLALETLQVCDDHTGAHGAFAVSPSPTKGFMKKWHTFRTRKSSGI